MKLHFFIIMSLGLMMLFNLAGVETGSSKIINFMGFSNQEDNLNINPDIPTSEVGTITEMQSRLFNDSFFYVLGAFFVIVGLLSIAKVSALSFSWNPSTEAVFALFALGIWGIFATDVYSIIKLVGEVSGRTGWAYNLVRVFLFTYLIGFAMSLITFIRTGE